MHELKGPSEPPSRDEVRDLMLELRLRGFYEQQSRQLPVIVTLANSPEYFGLCALAEHDILDRRYQHIPPSEKSSEYDALITDLSAVVNDYRTILQRGFSSPEAASCSMSLWKANNTLTVEAKMDSWEFIRRCAGVEQDSGDLVKTGCAYRGHIVQPLACAVRSEPECDRVNAVIAVTDGPIALKAGGNPETIVKTLVESDIISDSHLRLAAKGEARAAPIIREMGIPCIVLDDHPNAHYTKIEREVRFWVEQDESSSQSRV